MRGTYPDSPSGRFKVIDSIPTSHGYCVGPRHVKIAADHHGGMLDEAAIEDAENRGIHCYTCKGKLAYREHESALLVECAVEPKEAEKEVQDWLKAIAPEGEKNGYVGFAFTRSKNFVESPKCPDGLLPDGETCPKCGGHRAPSGVGGGTWVHFQKKT